MDWKQCEAFLAVIDAGSFEQAASRLHLTPSAVSQRVRALEGTLGHPLVVRGRPCRATPVGQQLLQHLRRSRLLEQDFVAEIAGEASAPLSVTLAVNADTLATWLLPALADFLVQQKVLIDLVVDDQAHTFALLEAGLAMACVSVQAQAMRGCVAEPLGPMRYRLVASPACVDRWFKRGFTRAAARRAPVIVFNRKDRLQADILLRELGLPDDAYPCHQVPASEPFLAAIRLGLGYGMVPELQLGDALARGELIDLAPHAPTDVALYWHRWQVQSPRLERLSQTAVAAARQRFAG
ncbi:LysR family transcriptional regulator ArgP [Aquabacterium sp.]|uniref:LysR family transcriptional regulator ArgP n=1 Tax=Aquabacterium sp. TaxID=1872578 RepID=UPI002B9DDFEE|nr:LysR family transcriptional regulator ArgP [Aquabacterium sp.]HSW08426.1 LysR family transcriptional regulator ArgP [Aquabacterium sp.]